VRVSVRIVAAMIVGSLVLVGCAALKTQEITVEMTEGPWVVDPVTFDEVGTMDITLSNSGSETHLPLVASTLQTAEALENHMSEFGTANLVDELAQDENTVRGIGAALAYGNHGHFHPGGDDEVSLPDDARVDVSPEEETTHYLFAPAAVAPGAELSISVSTGKDLMGTETATSWVVVCMNEDHFDNGEYAVFAITQP
jgi:hypothetical protein